MATRWYVPVLAMKLDSLKLWLAVFGASGALAEARLTPEQVKALPPAATRRIHFAKDIQPILETSCVKCHGNGKRKGNFSLDTRASLLQGGESGAAVVAGQSAASPLIEMVSALNPDNVMPQKGSRLKPAQIGLLRAWIDQGLKWDEGFTFKKPVTVPMEPRQPAIPVARKDSGLTNPVDLFLQPYFAINKIKPRPPVEDRVFARRVWLDVIGLLPPPAELDSFIADPQPDKRERLVQRLLADPPRYAEHWLTFWNDALRNDYRGTGYIDGGRKQITGWLYSALATNLPFNQFVGQLINPTPDCEGFTKGILWRGAVNASQAPPMQAAQNISQIFMGVNLKCASCHDSFINDWELADAYGLASIYADGPLEMFRCDKPTGKRAPVKFLYPALGAIDAGAPKVERLKQLAEIVTSPKDGRLTRTMVNRLWAKFLGRGLVEPVDEMDNPPWHADLLDWLAADLAGHGYDLKHSMARILTSRAYQMSAVNLSEQRERDFIFRGPAIRRLSAEQFRDALTSLTGAGYAQAEAPVKDAPPGRVRAALVAADPLLVALGRPNREQVITTRASAATTLQALELTNGGTLAALLKRGAENLLAAKPASGRELATRLYAQALGRPPTSREAQLALDIVGEPATKEGLEDLLWSLTMLPEFQLIY